MTGANNNGAAMTLTGNNWSPTNTSALLENAKNTSQADYDGYVAGSPSGQLGVSSQHQGGIVLHSCVDGHIGQVTNEIDANLYYSLWSRAEGEALTDIP